MAQASDILASLMAQGLVVSEPALVQGEVHTLYRVADATPPPSHAVH